MSRKGENIHKRKDGRWEARYIKGYNSAGKAIYGYTFGKSYLEVKRKRQETASLPLSLLLPTAISSVVSSVPTAISAISSAVAAVHTVGASLPHVTQLHPQIHQIVQVGGNVNVYSANTANNVLNNVLVINENGSSAGSVTGTASDDVAIRSPLLADIAFQLKELFKAGTGTPLTTAMSPMSSTATGSSMVNGTGCDKHSVESVGAVDVAEKVLIDVKSLYRIDELKASGLRFWRL